MKKTIIVIGSILFVILIAHIYLYIDLANHSINIDYSGNDAQAGMGIAIMFILDMIVNGFLCFTLLLISIIQGIRFRKLMSFATITLIGLIIICFFFPFILFEIT